MPVSELTVHVDYRPASEVRLQVEAPPSEFDQAIQQALKRLAGRIRVPGFRPGKAPGHIVERSLGWPAVRSEAIEQVVPALYLRAVAQAQVVPVGDPQFTIDQAERGEAVRFSAVVTVRPRVDLGDYRSLRVPQDTGVVTDEQVAEAIEQVRRQHSPLVDVDRPAQAGDVLRARLTMRRGDELLTAGGDGDRDLELDRDRLLPGMVDGIVGLTAGEERAFPITLPQDYPREELRGQEVTVDVAVTAVRERQLPDVDDALAALDGNATDVAGMRDFYREALGVEVLRRDEEAHEAAVLGALRDRVTVDIPDLLVERELDRMVREMEYRLSGMGVGFERFLELTGTSIERWRAERNDDAEQRVRLELGLDALAEAELIEVDESAAEREAQRLAEGQRLTASQRGRLRQLAEADLRRRAAVERLREIARGDAD